LVLVVDKGLITQKHIIQDLILDQIIWNKLVKREQTCEFEVEMSGAYNAGSIKTLGVQKLRWKSMALNQQNIKYFSMEKGNANHIKYFSMEKGNANHHFDADCTRNYYSNDKWG
jgi:hypothetical protein